MSVNIYRDGCMSVKIRVSIQVTVRSQDPKPKKNMERSTRAIPSLYHIVILCLSQPRNVRRLPGPPVYTFFGEMANHLGWGGPKHTALMTCLYMLVSVEPESQIKKTNNNQQDRAGDTR